MATYGISARCTGSMPISTYNKLTSSYEFKTWVNNNINIYVTEDGDPVYSTTGFVKVPGDSSSVSITKGSLSGGKTTLTIKVTNYTASWKISSTSPTTTKTISGTSSVSVDVVAQTISSVSIDQDVTVEATEDGTGGNIAVTNYSIYDNEGNDITSGDAVIAGYIYIKGPFLDNSGTVCPRWLDYDNTEQYFSITIGGSYADNYTNPGPHYTKARLRVKGFTLEPVNLEITRELSRERFGEYLFDTIYTLPQYYSLRGDETYTLDSNDNVRFNSPYNFNLTYNTNPHIYYDATSVLKVNVNKIFTNKLGSNYGNSNVKARIFKDGEWHDASMKIY